MSRIIDYVGNTPLIQIPYKKNPKVTIYAKCEWLNPSGSVKDRAAANILQSALAEGLNDRIFIDATSGNTGIAYALFGASLGVSVALALPENASVERQLILKNHGVTLHLTSALEGTDGAQRWVAEQVSNHPHKYVYANQYANNANWQP
ncbi:MAG: pyridoxal-phosphate dependent enzyme, partial [Candidatus Marinamargulisbacteria bacterium]